MFKVYALLEETHEYVPPCSVDPGNRGKYVCSECLKPVIFRNCSTKIKHFAHKSEHSTCTGVGVSESDIHKFAKNQIKRWLEQGYTLLLNLGGKKDAIYLSENQQVFLEKGDKNYRADVMIKENDKIICIIEVTYTNATVTQRPCKWYDIDALNIEDPISIDMSGKIVELWAKLGKIQGNNKSELTCEEEERIEWSDYAGERIEKCKRFKLTNIGHRCSIPCMECKKTFYYPIYSKKHRCYLNMCAYGCKEYPHGLREMHGSLYNTSKSNDIKLNSTSDDCWCEFCKRQTYDRTIDKMFIDASHVDYGSHSIIKIKPYYQLCEI